LRIVTEYNYERLDRKNNNEKYPFWRIIDPSSKLSEKLSFNKEFIMNKRDEKENLTWVMCFPV
jgi:hypothetical protein